MDAEGSHSGDRNGCGDGKQWRRGTGIVGEGKGCWASGRDAEGNGWWASGASSASERHDYG